MGDRLTAARSHLHTVRARVAQAVTDTPGLVPRWSSPARIVFIHAPKCGGTSVRRALRLAGGVQAVAGRSIRSVDATRTRRLSELLGEPLATTRERILLYHMTDPSCRLVSGHLSVSPAALQSMPGWEWVTLVRDPEARWLSQYFYNREKAADHFRVDQSLDEFLESDRARRMGEDYVRRFSGFADPQPVGEAEIAVALANLERFAIAGTLERIEEFCATFRRRYGIRLRVAHRNRNPLSQPRQRDEITADARARICAICAPDRRIYEAVLDRLSAEAEDAQGTI